MKIITLILTIALQFLIADNIKIFDSLYTLLGILALTLISGMFLMLGSSDRPQKIYSIGRGMVDGTITSILFLILITFVVISWPTYLAEKIIPSLRHDCIIYTRVS